MTPPLIVTADPALRDDLLRLAAAAGVAPAVVTGLPPPDGPGSWRSPPAVLVGADVAARASLPRRPDVVLVGRDTGDPAVWQRAVALGASEVVFLPEAEPWLLDLFVRVAGGVPSAALVAVVGARGGAGATTVAVALAFAGLRGGRRTVLLDLDPYGGGADLVAGAEAAPGPRWPDLLDASAPVVGDALVAALPRAAGGLPVLSYGRSPADPAPPGRVRSVVTALRRVTDLVIADLPRSFDAAGRAVLPEADRTLVVCPAEVRACASGGVVAAVLRGLAADVRVVVRGPSPGGLSGAVVAAALGLPYAGWLDAEDAVVAALERGDPPGRRRRSRLAVLADDLVGSLPSRGGPDAVSASASGSASASPEVAA